MDYVALGIAVVALAVAGLEVWLNYLRRGNLRMTRPTLVCFCSRSGNDPEKVFLRTLLYSTSQRGQMIESMHISLQCGESKQGFTFWAYGDNGIVPGSGLFVGLEGVSHNHHFLLSHDEADYRFVAGEYVMRVYAKRVSDHKPRQLSQIDLRITDSQAQELDKVNTGIYFTWRPEQQRYHAHVETRGPN